MPKPDLYKHMLAVEPLRPTTEYVAFKPKQTSQTDDVLKELIKELIEEVRGMRRDMAKERLLPDTELTRRILDELDNS